MSEQPSEPAPALDFEACCDDQRPATDENAGEIRCANCEHILRGEIHATETSLSYGGAFPEWWINEQHEITIRTYRQWRGWETLTLTENDLRAMLAEVKNA